MPDDIKSQLKAAGCTAAHLNKCESAMQAAGFDWQSLLPKLIQALPMILQLVALFGDQPKQPTA